MEDSAEEPHKSVPVPSPHPSSGLEESSALLELTPEKPARRRRNRRPVQLKQHDIRDVENGHDHNTDDVSPDIRACAQLAVPGLNTTTPLYHQLQQYMQAKDDRTKSGGQKTRETANRDLQRVLVEDPLPPATVSDITSCQSSNVSTTATASSVGSKSSEDESAPASDSRYSNLVAVDVSEESFRRMTTRPRKTRHSRGSRGREEGGQKSHRVAEEPNIMDFFSADFEMEEVGVDICTVPPATHRLSEPVLPSSSESALTLYHFINKDL